MKKILVRGIILVILAATIGSLAGCNVDRIVGSSNIITKDYDFTDFKNIEVSNAFEVDIVRADSYSVSITLNDNLFENLDISRSGDTLRIRMQPFTSFIHSTLKASISLPDLSLLRLSGATHGTVTGFNSDNPFRLYVSGASSLETNDLKTKADTTIEISGASRISGSLETGTGDFDISGASYIELNGSSSDVSVVVSGASRAKLSNFSLVNASLEVSSASSADIAVSGLLDVDVSGASRLTYTGNPQLGHVDVSGASTLKHQ